MLNYIDADIKRILKKIMFLLTSGLFICLFILMLFIKNGSTYKTDTLIEDIRNFSSWFPFIVGLPIFLSVFADDLNAKTMQVAIGFGISRNKVILSKLIETVVLSLLICVVSIVAMIFMPIVMGLKFNTTQVYTIVVTMIIEVIHLVGFISIGMPFVFFSQNTTGGLIIYVLLSSKMAQIILSLILENEFITNIFGHASKYLLTLNLYYWRNNILAMGNIITIEILVTAFYILLLVILTIYLFKDSELEF
ncbi:hypothetical protein ABGF26_05430 [Helcococcus ovis]|uniref:hypothetical protein n=1 Tax=Helcococcus ovis TaxID=72026 RepID=UPI0038B8452A